MLSWQFLTDIPRDMGRSGGISSSIVGTLIVTAVAVIVATPFGIGTAIYLRSTHVRAESPALSVSVPSLWQGYPPLFMDFLVLSSLLFT